jgi:hypothetical protein
MIVQDATDAADTLAAFRSSGLDRFAYTHRAESPWPTLGSLVRNATPLVVFSENNGPEPGWFHAAFDALQDTPYLARSVDELTCDRNRGSADARLFLLNHWITSDPPDVNDAVTVNSGPFLTQRARRCEAERNRKASIIAVNYWQTGDLLVAIDQLNDVEPK